MIEDPVVGRVYRLAQQAAMTRYRPADFPHPDAFDVAVEVILEAFAEGIEDRVTILRRCNIRIQYEARQARMFGGRIAHEPGRYNPRFILYAHVTTGHVTSFADDLDERIAVLQVYFALSERDREVLWMEACGESEDRPGWRMVVRNTRARARRLWFDHETPQSRLRVRGTHPRRRTA